jgi:hypothetical protein
MTAASAGSAASFADSTGSRSGQSIARSGSFHAMPISLDLEEESARVAVHHGLGENDTGQFRLDEPHEAGR